MYKGVHIGRYVDKQPKKVLILGESHHAKWETEQERIEKELSYTTEAVIGRYFANYRSPQGRDTCYRFFDKIVQSFGIDPEVSREAFWESVYFGNYVEQFCGVGNDAAKRLSLKNRNLYNDALFAYLNEHGIDTVFCFSRLVVDRLPSLAEKSEDGGVLTDSILVHGKRDYIGHCVYKPHIAHCHTDVLLERSVSVYGMRHPSAKGGFCPENYAPVLREAFSPSLIE